MAARTIVNRQRNPGGSDVQGIARRADHAVSRPRAGRGRLSGACSLIDLPGYMLLKGALVQLVVAKRRDQRDERSLEHRFLRDCVADLRLSSLPSASTAQERPGIRAQGRRSNGIGRRTCSGSRKTVRVSCLIFDSAKEPPTLPPIVCGLLPVVLIFLALGFPAAAAQTLPPADM